MKHVWLHLAVFDARMMLDTWYPQPQSSELGFSGSGLDGIAPSAHSGR